MPSQTQSGNTPMDIAVCLPCHNEAGAIATVIKNFRYHLPHAKIYVFDNASTDDTARAAGEAGAIVRTEPLKGKGNVVRRMFSDIEADIYLLVDGDGTYDPSMARVMIDTLVAQNCDMVTGTRVDTAPGARRPGHRGGNQALTGIVQLLFGNRVTDMLSGYRVFSRRFVKSFPVMSSGFEIETELTIHALELRMGLAEIATPYAERPEGTNSKLRTYRDGFRILMTILDLVGRERPMWVFGGTSAVVLALSVYLALPVLAHLLETGMVPRFPTAILSMILMIVSFLSLTCGLIIRMITLGRQEMKRLAYLSEPSLAERIARETEAAE